MEFQKYPSLLKYRKKHTDTLYGRKVVLVEKIHGSNFSFWCERNSDGQFNSRVGKRTSFLEKDERFFNYKVIVDKYMPRIQELAYHLFQDGNPHTLIVVGEYFGGIYDNKIPQCSFPIQRGHYANYCQHNDFAVFDIILDGFPIDWDIVVKYCQEYGLYSAPEIKRGFWQHVSNFSVENYKSPTAEHFNGLNDIPSQIEGVIIRPLDTNAIDQRIKWKCEGMLETPIKMSPKLKKEDPFEKYSDFLNENRVDTYYSKIGDGQWDETHLGTLIKGLVEDALTDIHESLEDTGETLDAKSIKTIRKNLSKKAAQLLRNHMKNT